MRSQDAETVLRVLEGFRRQITPWVHPRTDPIPTEEKVLEAIGLVRLEIASNHRRGDAKRRQ